jgi:hypothetical protein
LPVTEPSADAFAQLTEYLRDGRLNLVVASLEDRLGDADASTAAVAGADAGMNFELLAAAMMVRRDIGRLNDLIHATAITLALPQIMEPGERMVNRPSLAAGNSPSQRYDVETDLRIAEFKLAMWSGTDSTRKRGVFADLLHLAADTSGRRPELYVVGQAPIRFLRSSRSSATWALNRGADSARLLYLERFGNLDLPVREFTAGPASHVRLVDLAEILPPIAALFSI